MLPEKYRIRYCLLSTKVKKSAETLLNSALSVGQSVNVYSESCTSLVACMPVEIFMRQGGWASISKGSVMASLKWFTIAWTLSL
jgi:hypothetical protein